MKYVKLHRSESTQTKAQPGDRNNDTALLIEEDIRINHHSVCFLFQVKRKGHQVHQKTESEFSEDHHALSGATPRFTWIENTESSKLQKTSRFRTTKRELKIQRSCRVKSKAR